MKLFVLLFIWPFIIIAYAALFLVCVAVIALVVLGVQLAISSYVLAGTLTLSEGFKSENLRFGGGKIVSTNAVNVASGQYTSDSGLYGRFWSTANANESDFELDVGGGLVKPCFFDILKCKLEATYWVLPKLDTTVGDLVNLAAEVSGKTIIGDGESFGYSVRFEKLLVFGKPDNQIYRANVSYERTLWGLPVRALVEYDYNEQKNWSHLPVSLSATWKPSWLPESMSVVPSLDVLIPLNDRDVRKTGIAFGLALVYNH